MFSINSHLFFNNTHVHGFFYFLSEPLFYVLAFFNKIFKNWGFSIIMLTIFIRIIMYPLARFQQETLAKITNLQPQILNIKEKFKHDYNESNVQILKLYKENNVNPLYSFLPILLQTPFFLALYHLLTTVNELKRAPFVFWIQDLSTYDPCYILPMILGFTIYLLQISSLNSQSSYLLEASPSNKYFIILFSVFMALFFMHFPSGLLIYYIVNNIISII
ncbi:membrane protein insertase YidC [Buchnera aphidicola]|uniref:membrane protein insertase YidC n=1 Tax=Buchnera aphidicola TaxID=9 RepID=UPI0030EB1BFE